MISTYKYTDESIEHLASSLKTKQNKKQQVLCKNKNDRLYYFLSDQKGLFSMALLSPHFTGFRMMSLIGKRYWIPRS